MPSYKQCLAFGKAIGWEPEDEVQSIALDHLCSNPYNILKALRQWGKTEVQAIHGGAGIPIGQPCGIGMPTLAQGGRILAARIEKKIEKFEKLPGVSSRRLIDNALYKMWSWSDLSVLGVISMHETGDSETTGKSAQGWTFQNLKIDESHECGIEVYKKLLHTTNRFRSEDNANISLLGVGGYPASLIETMIREDDRFKAIRVIPDLDNDLVPKGKGCIVTDVETVYNILDYPPYNKNGEPDYEKAEKRRAFYANERENSLGQQWSQMYMCETQHGGHGLIFADLPTTVPMFWNMNPRKTMSIDVGAGEDPTIVSVWWNDGTHRDLFECHRLVEHDVSKTVAWAKGIMERHFDRLDPANVRYEKNGPGKQFGIALQEYWPWKMAAGVHTSDQGAKGKQGKKTRWLQRAQRECAGGTFAVSDKWAHDQLARLSYEVDDDGNYKWPHDDVLSTVWIDFSNAGSAMGV